MVERTPPTASDARRQRGAKSLGDFSLDISVWRVFVLAALVGGVAAGLALALLDLIGLVTHVAYRGTFGVGLIAPDVTRLGAVSIVVPVTGGVIIGAMAYWGSERIRGHGIPEAMETVLVGGSTVEARLAVLKPLSSAVSIGTGGPFGAEGPIILTGGAAGSIVAQLFRFAAIERRTLLVTGACAGMAAVFGTPVAAALFGVELLAFEFKPRTMAPIAVGVTTATALRTTFAAHHLLTRAPLFPVHASAGFGPLGLAGAAGVGVACGLLAVVLTAAVYGFEDAFTRLPVHWALWPAIGGVVVGVGGLVDPRTLGVGYGTIGAELAGHLALGALATLLVTKLVIWSVALGSGTSGGILAPLLMMGAALGALMAPVLPGGNEGTWALIGLGATLAGVMRSPFTSIVFAFELTHDIGALAPLLAACTVAHTISALALKRSILTEKVARRGFHVVREYAVEPLEALLVREVMRDDALTVAPAEPLAALRVLLEENPADRRQRLFPVVGEDGRLSGVITVSDVYGPAGSGPSIAGDMARTAVVVAYADETLRAAADRMATHELGALPVVTHSGDRTVIGVITEFDLLRSRQRQLQEDRHRERIIRFRRANADTPVMSVRTRQDA